jgi:hypothetical protein
MLHCPVRMHEKVLTLPYTEVLNGKTKKEVNFGRRLKHYYIPPALGQAAVGSAVAKEEFQTDDGAIHVYVGCVQAYSKDVDGGLYSIRYEDGDTEDMDCEEYCEGHELVATMTTSSEDANVDKTAAFKKKLLRSLDNITEIFRSLGELGPTWTHQWSDTNSKALKNIKLPNDQSKNFFRVAQLEKLKSAIDIAASQNLSCVQTGKHFWSITCEP